MSYVVIVTVLALLEYQFFGIMVGRARGRYGIAAPATTGHEVFERYFRVHMNTLEQLALFLPALWIFGYYVSEVWAAGLGTVWIVGRAAYCMLYVKEPKSRTLGFALTAVPMLAMLLGTLTWAVRALVTTSV
jgi:glutathione S-transferase